MELNEMEKRVFGVDAVKYENGTILERGLGALPAKAAEAVKAVEEKVILISQDAWHMLVAEVTRLRGLVDQHHALLGPDLAEPWETPNVVTPVSPPAPVAAPVASAPAEPAPVESAAVAAPVVEATPVSPAS